jgi:L-asparaginase
MRLAILTTGGTIDKTYNESDGSLANVGSVLDCILTSLRHPGIDIRHIPIMSKDSLDMTDVDRQAILYAVLAAQSQNDAIILIHGTDSLAETGRHLHHQLDELAIPVVLTGAMRPYEFRDTDAVQNVTEALIAARLLTPGVWVAMHGQALRFPDVAKDRSKMTFINTAG